RIDEQVKIRGFRIEIGEIESRIREVDNVKECAVIARKDINGDNALYAYYTSRTEVSISEVRTKLAETLPDYMVPAYMMQIEKIPVTKNGKLDRRALPEIEAAAEREYTAPRTPAEEAVCKAFSEVLRIQRIGINDNFFELGGDSIKAIRVISKLRNLGYTLTVREIMNGKVIETIAKYASAVRDASTYEQGEVSGVVNKTPIMRMFDSWNLEKPEHFNQSMLLPVSGIETDIIRKTIEAVVIHHDALRMVYRNHEAVILPVNESRLCDYRVYDLSDNADYRNEIDRLSTEVQSSIDLSEGPVVKAAEFICGEEKYVLICVHHMAIDGVSWRIILEDLDTAVNQLMSGRKVKLPEKTASYIDWGNMLEDYTKSLKFEEDRTYWKNRIDELRENDIKLVKNESGTFAGYRDIKIEFSEEETYTILSSANNRFQTHVNDLLLSALARAIHDLTGQNDVTVLMESHGRETLHKEIIIDRTVGWFTNEYPVLIHSGNSIEEALISNRDMREMIPNNGIGFGLLYGDESGHICSVEFNYLGQFDSGSAVVDDSEEPISYGLEIAEENEFSGGISINGSVSGGIMSFTISYDYVKFTEDDMKKLSEMFRRNLVEVGNFCHDNRGEYAKDISVKLLKTTENGSNEEIEACTDSLCEVIDAYRNNVNTSVVETEYKITSAQMILFNSDSLNCLSVLEIQETMTKEEVLTAVRNLVKEQSALRSVYNAETQSVTEYSYNDNWEIPYIVKKDNPDIFRTLCLLEYSKTIFSTGKLQSFVAVVKRKRKHQVFIVVHHGLYDQYSGFVSRDRLKALLSGEEPGVYRYSDYVADAREHNKHNALAENVMEAYTYSLRKMTAEVRMSGMNEYALILDWVMDEERAERFRMKPLESIVKIFCEYNPMLKKIGLIPFTITYHGRTDSNNKTLGLNLANLPGLYHIETDTISGGMDLLDKDRRAPAILFDDEMYKVSYQENKAYALNYHGVFQGEVNHKDIMTETSQRVMETIMMELSCDMIGNGLELIIPIFAETKEAAEEQAEKSFEAIQDLI
ncbi:MAG: hypothetical protein J6A30_00425, partial [Ruminococcus sp.]|nr:hypothetical protein [Ruminococcus sp.]